MQSMTSSKEREDSMCLRLPWVWVGVFSSQERQDEDLICFFLLVHPFG